MNLYSRVCLNKQSRNNYCDLDCEHLQTVNNDYFCNANRMADASKLITYPASIRKMRTRNANPDALSRIDVIARNDRICGLYLDGKTSNVIAEELKIERWIVKRVLKDRNRRNRLFAEIKVSQ